MGLKWHLLIIIIPFLLELFTFLNFFTLILRKYNFNLFIFKFTEYFFFSTLSFLLNPSSIHTSYFSSCVFNWKILFEYEVSLSFQKVHGEQMKSWVNMYYWHKHSYVKDPNASNPLEWQDLPQQNSKEWQIVPLVKIKKLTFANTSVWIKCQLQLPGPWCWYYYIQLSKQLPPPRWLANLCPPPLCCI